MNKTENSLSLNELKNLIDNDNQIVIIDVRSQEEYSEKHIPKAVNISLQNLEEEAKFFDPVKIYITTCGKGGGRSKEASELLNNLKLKSFWLSGGTFGWFE